MKNFLKLNYIGTLSIILLLEILSRFKILNPVYFPPPTIILSTFFNIKFIQDLSFNGVNTVYRAILGYIISGSLAICIGVALGKINWVQKLFGPIVEFLRPLPSAAIIPVCILLLGIDDKMKITVIMFGVFWPTLVNTYQGIIGVNETIKDTGKLSGLTKLQQVLKIEIPYSFPIISAGLRISLAISLILAVTSEMIAGNDGLGFLLIDLERGFLFKEMYACIFLIGLIGYFLNWIFLKVEKKYLFWHLHLKNED